MVGSNRLEAIVLKAAHFQGNLTRMDEPIQIPIDGVLDLHTFKPKEIKDLLLGYLAACQEKGIYQLRIIHGKGIGNLQRTVHSILSGHPEVTSFALDHAEYGGWGATLVSLRPKNVKMASEE